jgi:hypothetical protein
MICAGSVCNSLRLKETLLLKSIDAPGSNSTSRPYARCQHLSGIVNVKRFNVKMLLAF